jgi:BMFP domain-containing protein YqiC
MTQTNSRFFDEIAKVLTGAAGAAQGVRGEVDNILKSKLETVLQDLDLVPREEFEAVRAMAQKAREENEKISARIAKLEAALEKQCMAE